MAQENPFEDKKTALAMLLIIAVVMVYTQVFITPSMQPPPTSRPANTPAQQPRRVQQADADTIVTADQRASAESSSQAASAIPGLQELRSAPSVSIKSDKFKLKLSMLGGRIISFKLAEHRESLGSPEPLEMVQLEEGAIPPLGVYSGNWRDDRVLYELVEPVAGGAGAELTVPASGPLKLLLKGQVTGHNAGSDPIEIQKSLEFSAGTFLFSAAARTSSELPNPMSLEWSKWLPDSRSADRLDPWRFTYLNPTGRIHYIYPHELLVDPLRNIMPLHWVSFDDKYFIAAMYGEAPISNGWVAAVGLIGAENNPLPLQGPESGVAPSRTFLQRIFGDKRSVQASMFVGPKDYALMESTKRQLERAIDLGFFSFLAHPLLGLLRFFDSLLKNWGLSIILLTLTLKFMFYPLQRAALKSMQSQQDLQPEIKALRERIKDPNQLNQEIFALFKRKGINPVGGCLPLLLQIPVFFGLNSALMHALELRHAHFAVWINDLSAPERLEGPLGINFPIMTLLMIAIMLVQQLRMPMQGIDPQQRKIMLIMFTIFPVIFLIYPFPSGLALYVFVNTFTTFVQQTIIQRDKTANPFIPTALSGVFIFMLGYVLTLI